MDTTTAQQSPSRAARPPSDPAAADPAVRVRQLSCSYGDFEALREVDVTVSAGQLLAVLGINGAGKTTLLDVLRGQHRPDRGTVRVLGLDPARDRRRLAAHTGVMLQDTALPDELTPVEFLGLWQQLTGPPTSGRQTPAEALARVGLAGRRQVRIGRLSGGERRRLDLAAAVSTDPDLLLVDEPTAGLDPGSRTDAWELLRGLRRRGTTIVLTTHHLDEAQALADRLAILDRGRIALTGPLGEILASRRARISCRLPTHTGPPARALTGDVTVTDQPGHRQLAVTTPDLPGDLRRPLDWAAAHDIAPQRLRASEPTLAEVFADIRSKTTAEQAAR